MDLWVTPDSWVIPYSVIVLGIQNMIKKRNLLHAPEFNLFYHTKMIKIFINY